MKNLFVVVLLVACSCCSSKTAQKGGIETEPTSVTTPYIGVSPCIQKLINQYAAEDKQNPPRKIYSYQYKGKQVYYVPAICCDFYSDLLDENCNVLGHPDGGITGKGDGKLPDLNAEKKEEKLVWEDKR
ncbi:MAG: hypothetical protein ABIT96_08665 [Ferruginibacter sp.]